MFQRPAVGGRTDTVSTTWPDITHFAPKLEGASAVPREVSSTLMVYTLYLPFCFGAKCVYIP